MKVNISHISIGQEEHYKHLDHSIIDGYKKFDGPIGVVIDQSNDNYRLVDGHNRIAAAKQEGKKIVPAVVAVRSDSDMEINNKYWSRDV